MLWQQLPMSHCESQSIPISMAEIGCSFLWTHDRAHYLGFSIDCDRCPPDVVLPPPLPLTSSVFTIVFLGLKDKAGDIFCFSCLQTNTQKTKSNNVVVASSTPFLWLSDKSVIYIRRIHLFKRLNHFLKKPLSAVDLQTSVGGLFSAAD